MYKKHLGQNFLYDPSILARIIESANLSKNDTVVEIGPGPGRLTQLLAKAVKKVFAIEIDKDLLNRLKNELSGFDNIELIHADALKFPYETIGHFKVVANIPYYITTPLIFRLLEARDFLYSMTLTLQKEVAERITASPGNKKYGVLSVMVNYFAVSKLEFIIPKGAFRPVPTVDSAVVNIRILEKPSIEVKDQDLFFRVVKTAFGQRRKTLANSLKIFSQDIKNILISAGIDPMRRPETLSIREFALISDLLRK